jgi:hypothetical protein
MPEIVARLTVSADGGKMRVSWDTDSIDDISSSPSSMLMRVVVSGECRCWLGIAGY